MIPSRIIFTFTTIGLGGYPYTLLLFTTTIPYTGSTVLPNQAWANPEKFSANPENMDNYFWKTFTNI